MGLFWDTQTCLPAPDTHGAIVSDNALKEEKFNAMQLCCVYREGKNTRPFYDFKQCISLCNNLRQHSVYQNVQLFTRSKTGILNAAMFKYSLHKIR